MRLEGFLSFGKVGKKGMFFVWGEVLGIEARRRFRFDDKSIVSLLLECDFWFLDWTWKGCR